MNTSSCVNAHEIRYFIDGVLPPVGATCRQDTSPFAFLRPYGGTDTGGGAMADLMEKHVR
ncbi:hypothetical protein [Streptomyces sp. NPDC002133]|uniref:hypothetical protein n=1 Tax=Streptomyces sp. NPDC002133 TaxID=3154409 RepID=UPI0033281CA8